MTDAASNTPFQLMIKPCGAACNLACTYCYYLEKAAPYRGATACMDDSTLERVTSAYLQANPSLEVVFGWQGGEPLLAGIDFYRRALVLQARYARPGQHVLNAVQTNGTLITGEWAEFLAQNRFLVGISIDGPAEMHDRYRRDCGGEGSHHRVVGGLEKLLRHGVAVNALVTVNRRNMDQPLDVYHHLKGSGLRHFQFIPVVEWESRSIPRITPWSVQPEAFGAFLCAVFDEWAMNDVGDVFVQIFESALNVWLGRAPTVCTFSAACGRALVAEHNGDLYACDHYVYRKYLRGSITPEALADMVDSPEQTAFGHAKADLPDACKRCKVLRFCGGDCPKHRPPSTRRRDAVSYLCPAYRRFFTHSGEVLQSMASDLRMGQPATGTMESLRMLKNAKLPVER
jgi:uncharacterized protein